MGESEGLTTDSDFERTFGVVDTCSTATGDVEVGAALSLGRDHSSERHSVIQLETFITCRACMCFLALTLLVCRAIFWGNR